MPLDHGMSPLILNGAEACRPSGVVGTESKARIPTRKYDGRLAVQDEAHRHLVKPIDCGARDIGAGAGEIVGAAFAADAGIVEHDKETVRKIRQTVRVGDDLAAKESLLCLQRSQPELLARGVPDRGRRVRGLVRPPTGAAGCLAMG
jgi:hypothetical protein